MSGLNAAVCLVARAKNMATKNSFLRVRNRTHKPSDLRLQADATCLRLEAPYSISLFKNLFVRSSMYGNIWNIKILNTKSEFIKNIR